MRDFYMIKFVMFKGECLFLYICGCLIECLVGYWVFLLDYNCIDLCDFLLYGVYCKEICFCLKEECNNVYGCFVRSK